MTLTTEPASADSASSLLAGLRVIDLSRNLPGPFCTRMLADLGAEIIKVEPPEGDPTRSLAPLFEALNHGKECRTIDFRQPDELATLRGWLSEADVLVDSFRPGALETMGLDYASLAASNPKLVAVSITGYGQHGPWARRAGHDLNFMAMSGALDQSRSLAGELNMSNVQWGDLAGGSSMAGLALLAAVINAQRHGQGCQLVISMAHGTHAHLVIPKATAAALIPLLGHPPGAREDLLNGGLPCYDLYATADHRYLAVGALEYKFWKAACTVFERPDWIEQHWQRGQSPGSPESRALREQVGTLIVSQPLSYWSDRFETIDACVTPVLTLQEAQAHPLFTDDIQQPWRTA